MMRPLRLTWRLATPMAGGPFPLHLDSLVACAVTEEALREGTVSNNGIRSLARDLPLEKDERNGTWCWKASAITGRTQAHALRLWTRKTDPYEFAEMAANGQLDGKLNLQKPNAHKIDTARGLMKQHFQFVPVRHVEEVTAWCVGDPDRLLELLSPETGYIIALGARVRSGFGKIANFAIEDDERANELWARRVLPWSDAGLVPICAAHHPPYWAAENRTVQSWVAPDLLG